MLTRQRGLYKGIINKLAEILEFSAILTSLQSTEKFVFGVSSRPLEEERAWERGWTRPTGLAGRTEH